MCTCKILYPVKSSTRVASYLECVSKDKVHFWVAGDCGEGSVDMPMLPHGPDNEWEEEGQEEDHSPLHNIPLGEPAK